MAKNEKVRVDEFSLDSGLDFDNFAIDDIDGQISPEAKKPKSRSPVNEVFQGTISGAVDRFKSPSFLAGLTRKALPETFGVALDTVDSAAGTASALYDDAVRELKPQASRLARKIDRLVPEERKSIKAVTSRLARLFGVEDETGPSKEQIQEQSIQIGLAQIFDKQQATQEELAARDAARENIKDDIDRKQFQANLGILTTISNNVGRMASYKERVEQAVQRKSLELQYRSYFALAEISTTNRQYYEVFKAQNEAIAKNTALPEFVKIKNTERFKDLARTKFIDKLQGKLFGEGSALDRGIKRLGADLKQYVGGIKQGLESASMGVDAYADMQEMNKVFAEMGQKPISGAHLAGSMMGGWLANKVGDKVGGYARKYTENYRPLTDRLYKFNEATTNLPGFIDEYQKSEAYQKRLADGGMLATWGDKLLNYGKDTAPDLKMNNPMGLSGPMAASVFNDKTQRSITDIIPGYLARILREITVLRSGDDSTGMMYFDSQTGKFVEKKVLGDTMKKVLSKSIKSSNFGIETALATSSFTSGHDVTDDQKKSVSDFLAKVSTIPNMKFTPENIMKTKAYESLPSETKDLVRTILEKKVTQADGKAKGQHDLTRDIMKVRNATPDVRGVIELLLHNGFGEALEESGLVKQNEDGDYEINEDAYYDMVRKEGIVVSDRNKKEKIKPVRKGLGRVFATSDVNVKEDIHPLHPKRALDAICKTGIFDWMYKKGEGDRDPHRGPMAQDVNKNMGEEAAPGGTKIDLTTMNGNNMAAIQELADRQDKLKAAAGKDAEHLELMKQMSGDVTAIREILEKGGFGGGTGGGAPGFRSGKGYKDILSNLFTAGSSLLGQASKDMFDAASKVFKFSKDKIAKPLGSKAKDLYEKNKEPVGAALKNMLAKAGEMATRALDIGRDVVFNKLPAGWRQAAVLGSKLKDKIKGWINQARDVYVQGRDGPVLKAALIRAGYYRDKVTGKVIKTMDDLANLKGDIVNQAGETVLSIEEAANGLYDQYGDKIKSTFQKLAGAAMAYAAAGYERAKKFWKGAMAKGGNILGGLKEKFSEMKYNGVGFGMGGSGRIYDVLVEIRDLLRGEDPPRHEGKRDFKKNFVGPMPQSPFSQAVDSAKGKVDDLKQKGLTFFEKLQLSRMGFPMAPQDFVGPMPMSHLSKIRRKAQDYVRDAKGKLQMGNEFVGPQPQSKTGKLFDQIKLKANELMKSAKDKYQQATGGAEAPSEETTTTETQSTGPGLASPEAKYTGGGGMGIVGGAMSLAGKLPGLLGKGKAKLGTIAEAAKGAKGIKGKAGAIFGSLFKKNDAPAAPGEQPKEAGKAQTPAQASSQQSATPEAATTTTTTKKKRGIRAALGSMFNDRDGNGRRDGSWEDRFEAQAAKDKARKGPELQQAQAKYVSEKDIFQSIGEKASGIFSFLTKGASGIFDIASSLMGSASSVLGLGKSAGGLLGKLAGGLGKGAMAAGRGILATGKAIATPLRAVGTAVQGAGRIGMVSRLLSAGSMIRNVATVGALATGGAGGAVFGAISAGLSAVGAVLASPVVLGAVAVAAVGYGAYKLYKYMTRDNVEPLEKIRMSQYGLNQANPIAVKHNHFMLALEEYLLDGRVGYDGGKAYLLDKKIDPQELLDMFSIDKDDQQGVANFTQWFERRFKPFFLTNVTALFSVNKGVRLNKADGKLKEDEKIKFLGLCSFESGPYRVLVSPFKDMERLEETSGATKNLIDEATKAIQKKQSGKAEAEKAKAKQKIADAAKPMAPVVAAPKPAEQKEEAKKDQQISKSIADANKEMNKAIGKPTEVAEDGPLKETKPTGETGPVDKTIEEGPALSNKLKTAGGPVRDGAQGMQFLKMANGVNMDTMNPAMKEQFLGMIQEYGEQTGKSVTMTSGSRTTDEQEKLWRQNPKKAAPPGRSLHEFGLAFDMNSGDLDELEKLGLMRKYGFTRPVGGEPWHTEAAGIQVNLEKAKKNPDFASQAIGASLFKGGGGVGSIRGTPLGKRDSMFARAQMTDSDTKASGDAVAKSDKDKVNDTVVAGAPLGRPQAEPSKVMASVKMPEVGKVSGATNVAANDAGVKQAGTILSANQQAAKYSLSNQMPDLEAESQNKATVASAQVDTSGPNGDIKTQVAEVARKQNVNPNDMLTFAAMESSLNPNAKASGGSSASGLFGYTNATWSYQLKKDGPRLNLGPNPSPFDVEDSTMMASEYYKTNKKFLSSVKPNPTMTDVYLAHFLGPGGARKFLSADPNAIAADVVPDAAAANRTYFYEGSRPLTVAEVYRKIDTKLAKKAKDFGINYSGGGELASRSPSQRMAEQPPVTVADAGRASGQVRPLPQFPGQQNQTPVPEAPRARPTLRMPQLPQTSAIMPDRVSQSQPMGSTVDAMGSANTTLVKQLEVQTKILGVLEKILDNTDLEKIAKAFKSDKSSAPAAPPAPRMQEAKFEGVKSAIDLGRKVA